MRSIGRIYGYATVFNRASVAHEDENGRRVQEKFLPGAFANSIRNGYQDLCWNHDAGQTLLRSGDLWLDETAKVLRFDVELADTKLNRWLLMEIHYRRVTGMSVQWNSYDVANRVENGEDVRVTHEARLEHLSPVYKPLFPGTIVMARLSPEMVKADRQSRERRMRLAEVS